MSEWDELKDHNFWKAAWGFDTTQSPGQRVKEFCVTAVITGIVLVFAVALLQGLFSGDNSYDGGCDPLTGFCEGPYES